VTTRSSAALLRAELKRLLRRRRVRAQSLIVTIFGDTVSQHGGSLWLGSLIETLAMFGIGERLTRTSVYRLVQDDWLEVDRVGRRSYYQLASHGQREYERAAQRIYSAGPPRWDGKWTLAVLHDVPVGARESLRMSLLWNGFGQLAPGVFAHPSGDSRAARDLVGEMDLTSHVLIMKAAIDAQAPALTRLVHDKWELPDLANRYRRFVSDFVPIDELLPRAADDALAFFVRTLIVHEYRRVLLHDPDLPDELLPEGWPGRDAAALMRSMYRRVAERAADYIVRVMTNQSGVLPAPGPGFRQRFTGR